MRRDREPAGAWHLDDERDLSFWDWLEQRSLLLIILMNAAIGLAVLCSIAGGAFMLAWMVLPAPNALGRVAGILYLVPCLVGLIFAATWAAFHWRD